jgi:hypothetical protein
VTRERVKVRVKGALLSSIYHFVYVCRYRSKKEFQFQTFLKEYNSSLKLKPNLFGPCGFII